MAERIISLSIDRLFDGDHNSPKIAEFLEAFGTALYAGEGRPPQILAALGIDTAFPVRLLVGIPQRALSREKRLFAEAFCGLHFGRDLGDNKGLWSYGKPWQPTNPRATARRRAVDCELDTDWMLSLGIAKATWENDILLRRQAFAVKHAGQGAALIRHMLALAAFGFSDPYQFFVPTTADDTGSLNYD